MKKSYHKIIDHYEKCLDTHRDNHLGLDWPNLNDNIKRFKIMLDLFNSKLDKEVSMLDFGCGTGHLLDYINEQNLKNINYSGLDISKKFINLATLKNPDNIFYCLDILESKTTIPSFDYIVMNGVFTEKRELSFDQMWDYFKSMISVIYNKCNSGMAFNVMSKNVDWERDELFHLSHDLLTDFLCKNITRNYIIRNDYGLYEYTVYLYK